MVGALAIHLLQLFSRKESYNYGNGASYSPPTYNYGREVSFHYGTGALVIHLVQPKHLLGPITCRQPPPVTYSLETILVKYRTNTSVNSYNYVLQHWYNYNIC